MLDAIPHVEGGAEPIAVQQAADEAEALFHHPTRFPRHVYLSPQKVQGEV
jgi:hypothetical protein